MKKLIKNLGMRGFSMLEMMVTVGISGALSVVVTQMYINNQKQIKSINSDFAINEVVSNIQFVLSTGENCNANFRNRQANRSGIATILDEFNTVIYQTGGAGLDREIQIVDFETYKVSNEQLGLRVTFERNGDQADIKRVQRELALDAEIPANIVLSCSQGSNNDVNLLLAALCSGNGMRLDDQGTPSDPDDDICVHYGYSETKCPAGEILNGFTFNAGNDLYEPNCVPLAASFTAQNCPANQVLAELRPDNTIRCRPLVMNDIRNLFQFGTNVGSGYTACTSGQFSQLYMDIVPPATGVRLRCN